LPGAALLLRVAWIARRSSNFEYEIQNFSKILLPFVKGKTRRSLHANTSGEKAQDNKPCAFHFVARVTLASRACASIPIDFGAGQAEVAKLLFAGRDLGVS
jgi:hypothetical protein